MERCILFRTRAVISANHFLQDTASALCPDERLGLGVVASDALIDGAKQFCHAGEHAVTWDTSATEAAVHWLSANPERAPRIYSAAPDSATVVAWVKRFRLALPERLRPDSLEIRPERHLGKREIRLE